MRWPAAWQDASALERLRGTPVDWLWIDDSAALSPVRSAARSAGLRLFTPDHPAPGIVEVRGEWPGIKGGERHSASAGPTGEPWVDANGWRVQVAQALHPGAQVCVDASLPEGMRGSASSYRTTIADAAASGGRWILNLPPELVAGIQSGNAAALETWSAIIGAAKFFEQNGGWGHWHPQAVIGVVADFAGEDESFSHEVANLLARAGSPARILPQTRPLSLAGLRAVIYAGGKPAQPVQNALVEFARGGGMLIASQKSGFAAGTPDPRLGHPRYQVSPHGRGRIALAESFDDPFEVANDAVILVSHRYDLVRFWNGGATGYRLLTAPAGGRAVAHLLFYADRAAGEASVRIAGPYRNARIRTIDHPEPRAVEFHVQSGGVEVHLPAVSQYAAIELS